MSVEVNKRKHQLSGERVTFVFTEPQVFVSKRERRGLSGDDERPLVLRWAAKIVEVVGKEETAAELGRLAERLEGSTPLPSEDEIPYGARAVKHVIRSVANAAFPKPDEVKRKDRISYREWQEHIEFDGPDEAEVTLGAVEWLRNLLDKETTGLPLEFSQWAEAVLDYCKWLYGRTVAGLENAAAGAEVAGAKVETPA